MNIPLNQAVKGRILIVDDIPENLRVLDRVLTKHGYEVRGVLSGAMALRAAESAQPDVILLDIRMPDLDGYQVCQALKSRQQTRKIPVIFLSALDDTLDKVKAFAAGGVDYITKPFQTEEVLARIQNQLIIQAAQAEICQLNAELEARVLQRTEQLSASNRQLQAEINQRRKTEQALRQSEERFRRAVLYAPFPIIIHAEDGEILEINQTWTELTGYSPQEIPTISAWIERAYRGDEAAVRAHINRLYHQRGTADEGEFTLTTRTGEQRIWYFSSANLGQLPDGRYSVISMAVDVTEQKLAEQDRDRLITILEASTDYIGIANPQGQALWSNTQAKHLLGLAADADVSQKKIPDYHPQWALDIVERQGIPTASHHGIWVGETAVRQADGNELPVSQMIIAHKSETGDIEYFSTIMRDISSLKLAEAEIRQLNADLEARVSQRTVQLEAANQELKSFSYSVSHDLRAPLRHIQGFVTALRRQLEQGDSLADSKSAHYLQVIEASSSRMEQLIEGLLKLSRIGRQELVLNTVELQPLVQSVIDVVLAEFEASTIDLQIGNLPAIMGDTALLQQVFTNLLSNAIKFSRDRRPAKIEVGSLPDSTIFVRDNGVGFSMDYADQLFGAFQRLHSRQQFEGTGIGLSIVQRIIHRHGGSVWATSQPDEGATFYFKLIEPYQLQL
ncbi:response regulator [Sphaerothrix gracilis]|uniref:response regulator n=1 Tax=Sphaerothrix gracilis TaxID=3151835 RepID=UPI0031FE2251